MVDGITVFDTSICTENIGDEIIMDAVKKELRGMFPHKMFLRVPTHEKVTKISLMRMKQNKIGFVGGTNLLNLNMQYPINQWNIHLKQAQKFNNVVLMGVGASHYHTQTNFYSRLLYKNALTKNYIHSVRDEYTKERLQSLGFTNVINTGCPTLWGLTKEHCSKIPTSKSKNVVCTFTDYNRDLEKDKLIVDILLRNYENVYCWIQGARDGEYVNQLSDKLIIINPHLECYDEILNSDLELDFVGTRLHGGIRALQNFRRTIVISIDNRAREMGKNYNLQIIERDEVESLDNLINSSFVTDIKLNWGNIEKWKNQFIN